MKIKVGLPANLFILILFLFPNMPTAQPLTTALIYTGNNAAFTESANEQGRIQGFTSLRDEWNTNGISTSISSVFPENISGLRIFLATSPIEFFTADQVSTLRSFLANGGLLILSHNSSSTAAQNDLLASLDSSMRFGALRLIGTQVATVATAHPLTDEIPYGQNIQTRLFTKY